MLEPKWIRADIVLAIHQRQLAEHGGEAGLRDNNLLESALARPKNLWAYASTRPDIAALAASYAFGIARNHAFVDGDKQTAYAVCRSFLILNGVDWGAPQEEKYLTFLQLAAGQMDESALADWIRGHLSQ